MIVAGIDVTHPDRVVYPESSITKRQVAEYYVGIAKWMLPHMAHRPISMVRCPQGQGAKCFYQKHWTHAVPDGVGTVDVSEEDGEVKPYVFVKSDSGLVALVQYGVLEFHVWGAREDKIESPDRIVLDLDPAPDVSWARVVDTAKAIRDLLQSVGLKSWVKTTGGKGLHVALPIARNVAWEDVYDFVRMVTARMMMQQPDDIVDVASKAKRTGKIFLDYLRNSRGATAIAPWSTRSRDGAPISVPIDWKELDVIESGDFMRMVDAVKFAQKRKKDPWASMLTSRQQLTHTVMEKLLR